MQYAAAQNPDMEVVAVFTRRDPAAVQTVLPVTVDKTENIGKYANKIDVMILCGGSATDLNGYLFGSILTLTRADVILSVSLSAVVILLFVLFKNRIFAVTFDEPFAKSAGVRVGLYNGLLALLIAVTVVVGMRIVGTMLISSLIIFPALGAMQLAGSFRGVVLLSALISVVSFLCGLLFSMTLPAGATIVLCNLAALLICTVLGKVIKH